MKAKIQNFLLKRQPSQNIELPYGSEIWNIWEGDKDLYLQCLVPNTEELDDRDKNSTEKRKIMLVATGADFEYFGYSDNYLKSINNLHIFDITDRE